MQPSQSDKHVPVHVAIIMDGNGRWAEEQGLPRHAGHQAGVSSVRSTVEQSLKRGVAALTLFAFSSENWRRPAQEVGLLMDLFLTALQREVKRMQANYAGEVTMTDRWFGSFIETLRNTGLLDTSLVAATALSLGAFSAKSLVPTVSAAVVLLLIDFWDPAARRPLKRLLLEKVPFLVLVVLSSVATYVAQSGSGAVAADMAELCPDALLLNYSNPMAMHSGLTASRTFMVPPEERKKWRHTPTLAPVREVVNIDSGPRKYPPRNAGELKTPAPLRSACEWATHHGT